MKSGLGKMINQFRRLWADNGKNDKDFTDQETKLRHALQHLKSAADSLSRAAQTLSDVLNAKG
jgi:hypothetical protein